jgi:DNA-binding PadR family transcriptional regulator
MTKPGLALKQGTAELAVLSVLSERPLHGYELAVQIEQCTEGRLSFTLASLYPLLYRLERSKALVGEWRTAPSGRRRRYYRINASGKRRLATLRDQWSRHIGAMRCLPGLADA